ncbi:MAG: hypothetical protein WA071_16570 [Undibacterium umbellatum]|uniref:hypothetical protein n=1 Tax=Undibacterium umbellatum TaxID=2762300 RepID=UPI003BB570BD
MPQQENTLAAGEQSHWMPDQVRHDGFAVMSMQGLGLVQGLHKTTNPKNIFSPIKKYFLHQHDNKTRQTGVWLPFLHWCGEFIVDSI